MVSWYYRRLATGTPDSQTPPYDEERLEYESRSFWRRPTSKYLQFLRPTKATAYLLLIDLIIFGLLVYTLEPLITLLLKNEELFTPRVTLSQETSIEASWPDQGPRKIPRILHQTVANDTIPDKWVESQRSCKKAYSGFEYKLWTDAATRELIDTHYPWFLESWDNYAFPIQRADSLRYIVLYHYGGIYLDMDTYCNETFPLPQIESDTSPHIALFKSTRPTGVTNDFMIASAKHPVYASIISKLPAFFTITRFWARLQPYCNIMLSSGPLFLTLVVKDYLLEQPSLPSPAVKVVEQSVLAPYITDLESSTWHQADAKALMWLGARPWTWFTLGIVGTIAGFCVLNRVMFLAWSALHRRIPSVAYAVKMAKVA